MNLLEKLANCPIKGLDVLNAVVLCLLMHIVGICATILILAGCTPRDEKPCPPCPNIDQRPVETAETKTITSKSRAVEIKDGRRITVYKLHAGDNTWAAVTLQTWLQVAVGSQWTDEHWRVQ